MSKHSSGFTLIETLIGVAIFAIVATSIYFSYSNILTTIIISKFNLAALSILDNEIEAIRNMPYQDVGIQGGVPAGKLLAGKIVTQGTASFTVRTTVRNTDDPFDGKIGGVPNDLAPADYRLVEIEVSCAACQFAPVRLTTSVAPKDLEGATKNGALFVKVFDAFGNAVSNANVSILNTQVSPNILINDTTNVNGMLQLVDTATSSSAYRITVAKNGYSSDQTYPIGGVGNPNPFKPHATVAQQQVTEISFGIDKVSAISFTTANAMCVAIPDIDFSQTGTKLIGTDPDVLKYSAALVTGANGKKLNSNLEWDTYNIQNLDSAYDIGGAFTLTPLVLDPGSTVSFNWIMEPKSPLAVLVTTRNASGGGINQAKVTLSKAGFSQSLYTGRQTLNQTDWSAGNYATKSFNLEADNPAGEIHLRSIGSKYASGSQEWMISSTIDFGTTSATLFNLKWTPTTQPAQSGPDSLKIQIATNNDNATWNFGGPDGNAGSFYTVSDTPLYTGHNGQRYLRYKVFLKTDDHNFTPRLDDLNLDFSSNCFSVDQVFFKGLGAGTYTVTIEKSGYQTLIDTNLSVNKNWQEYRAVLNP